MSDPRFSLRGIDKRFPGVHALDGVDFDCRAGEVHALVGENGAGKSTLMKILSGEYAADAGSIELDGEPVRFGHPLDAMRAGIGVIHQEFALLPERTVAENLFTGRELVSRGVLRRRAMREETQRVLDVFGDVHGIRADSMVRDLDVAEQQMVEIAKALAVNARFVIMDEPTAALNDAECEVLFELIGRLRAKGHGIVYITHRMREITRLADRVTVLKDGRVGAAWDRVPAPDEIVHAMVGREVGELYPEPAAPDDIGEVLLSVQGGGNDALHDIDLELRRGEIAGLAGVQGAGRAALARALFGDEPFRTGDYRIGGASLDCRRPRDAIAAGVSMLPADRKSEALLLMQSIRDNGLLSARAFSPALGPRSTSRFGDAAVLDALLDELDVRAASRDTEAGSLSGGNQQKVVVARWLLMKTDVLLFVEPTRGIDVNAKAGIYRLMRTLARRGAAVLMVSSDLPELLGVADRIEVMAGGRITGRFPHGTDEATIMRAATGEHR